MSKKLSKRGGSRPGLYFHVMRLPLIGYYVRQQDVITQALSWHLVTNNIYQWYVQSPFITKILCNKSFENRKNDMAKGPKIPVWTILGPHGSLAISNIRSIMVVRKGRISLNHLTIFGKKVRIVFIKLRWYEIEVFVKTQTFRLVELVREGWTWLNPLNIKGMVAQLEEVSYWIELINLTTHRSPTVHKLLPDQYSG